MSIDVGEHLQVTTETSGHLARCELLVDSSERHAALVDLASLLIEFGSVERVVTADEEELTRVRGVGRQKAARIRDLVG